MSAMRQGEVLKLSSPATKEFWEVAVLYEDEHLMAIEKPSGLLTSPDRYDPERPNLMRLLHGHIARGVPWAKRRGLGYLANAHRLDFETSGVLLLARTKPVLTLLANAFGSERPEKEYFAIAEGSPSHGLATGDGEWANREGRLTGRDRVDPQQGIARETFEVDARLASHPTRPGVMRVDQKTGKKSRTIFRVETRFRGYTALSCRPVTGRTHQIRIHLRWVQLPLVGDRVYGGSPLWLSDLKPHYRESRSKEENPLLGRVALHARRLGLDHPITGKRIVIESPIPKDLRVAMKYLEKYARPVGDEVVPDMGAPRFPGPSLGLGLDEDTGSPQEGCGLSAPDHK